MPTLNWIGKDAVIRHHKDVPFRLLEADEELSHADTVNAENGYDGNLIVQGDNLHALKALLPKYAGKVKCIYIDPPYNTGNEGWVYNDNVKAPEIKKWLGQVVGKEAEDLSRHDKWLCMMYPRLVLLKQFLSEDGAIFVSIDDNEVANLRLLMDEIFGKLFFQACFIQKRRDTPDSRNLSFISPDHEYVLVFSKSSKFKVRGADKDMTKYSNPDKDPRGAWMSDNLTGLADATARPNLHYDIENPKTGNTYKPHAGRGWAVARETMNRLIKEERILWPRKKDGRPRVKRYSAELNSETTGFSTVLKTKGNVAGTKDLASIFHDKVFAFPKPIDLVRTLIKQITSDDSIVLDSFAGSGTTANAVLLQNKEDGGSRKFILCQIPFESQEQEKRNFNIAAEITSERVRRVAGGYVNAKGEDVAGLGGGFQYCRLSEEPLFNEFGDIRDDVSFDQLADFVWFAETGVGYTEASDGAFLGGHEGMGVYLLFNGILGDRKPEGGNILTHKVLEGLPEFDGQRVIYAAASRIGQNALDRLGIIFKQTPYSIQV